MNTLLRLPEPPAVIAAVGSGGKTTCLKAIACSTYTKGQRVLLTTTTHMRRETAVTSLSSPDEVKRYFERHSFLFAGSPSGEDKIGTLPESLLCRLSQLSDIVLVEADGSKELPMKYPAPWEPVLPKDTNHVLVLFGLSALGKPLAQVCHRWELAAQTVGCSGSDPVTPEIAAAVLISGYMTMLEQRGFSYTVVLNQADLVSPQEIKALSQALSPAQSIAVSLNHFPHDLTQKA